jgi:UDP-GlcNAc:undecaprenyl-phosphate GlcNAc-1-phosphate transferase
MDLLLAFVIAMVVTMALIPPLARAAARLHVLDDPDSRKVHSQPIPRVGGIAMVAGALLRLEPGMIGSTSAPSLNFPAS